MYLYYFAYGSNMSSPRLKARLPEAKPLGHGMASGFEVIFHKRGFVDGSGKCGLIHCDREQAVVHGVVFELPVSTKPSLDRIEGVGHGYDCIELSVQHFTLGTIPCQSYLATALDESLLPYDWYLEHVMAGAREHELPGDYLNKLSKLPCLADPDNARRIAELAIYQD